MVVTPNQIVKKLLDVRAILTQISISSGVVNHNTFASLFRSDVLPFSEIRENESEGVGDDKQRHSECEREEEEERGERDRVTEEVMECLSIAYVIPPRSTNRILEIIQNTNLLHSSEERSELDTTMTISDASLNLSDSNFFPPIPKDHGSPSLSSPAASISSFEVSHSPFFPIQHNLVSRDSPKLDKPPASKVPHREDGKAKESRIVLIPSLLPSLPPPRSLLQNWNSSGLSARRYIDRVKTRIWTFPSTPLRIWKRLLIHFVTSDVWTTDFIWMSGIMASRIAFKCPNDGFVSNKLELLLFLDKSRITIRIAGSNPCETFAHCVLEIDDFFLKMGISPTSLSTPCPFCLDTDGLTWKNATKCDFSALTSFNTEIDSDDFFSKDAISLNYKRTSDLGVKHFLFTEEFAGSHGSGEEAPFPVNSMFDVSRISDEFRNGSTNSSCSHCGASTPISWISPEVTLFSDVAPFNLSLYENQMRQIGEGAYCDIFLSPNLDPNLKDDRSAPHQDQVVIKVLKEEKLSDASSVLEFEREILILQNLRHTFITSLSALSLRPLGIKMEYMDLGDLREYILSEAPNLETILRFSTQIASAMNFLHTQNPAILHLDLKSPNILLHRDAMTGLPIAKVADFGKAHVLVISDSVYTIRSICTWTAPEILSYHLASRPSDVYSFGLVMWEMTSQRLPFDDCKWMASLERSIILGRRPDISEKVPPKLGNLIRSTWDGNPRLRPTFSDILESLKSL